MILKGFVGPAYTTRLLQASAEECLNLFPCTMESENASPTRILRGTPGLAVTMTLSDAPVRGQFSQDGRSFAVAGATLFETTSGAGVSLGAVVNDGVPVSFETNGSAIGAGGHQLYLVSGGHGYIYDLFANTFSEIASAGFPVGQALMGAYMDGSFLVCTPSFIGSSALEDGTTWDAASRGSRNIASDNLAGMLVNYAQHTLWVFGTKRTEVWYDNGAAVFNFAPIPGVFINFGLAARFSAARFDNSVVWLAQDENGTRLVLWANQYLPQRISTDAVEYDLSLCPDVSDFVGYVYQEEGHTFYVLSSVANQRTWVYDAAEKLWHKRGYWVGSDGVFQQVRGWNHCLSPTGAHWVGDWQTGNIYTQSLNYYDDAGNPLRAVRRVPHLTAERHRIFYPGVILEAQLGIGLPTGQGSDPRVMLRWSNNGGETWSNEYWRSLGRQGAYGMRAYWQRLGESRNRVFEWSMTDPVPRAWLNAFLDPDPVVGSN